MRDLSTIPEMKLVGWLCGCAVRIILRRWRRRTRGRNEQGKRSSERRVWSRSGQSLDFSRISSTSGHHIRYLTRDFSTIATSESTSRASRKLEVGIAH
jgi:hypothetical protein